MGLGFGVTSSFAVFMAPLEQDFGGSRAELSFAYTLMTIGMISSLVQTLTVFWFVSTPQMAIIIPVAVVFGLGFAGNMTA